MAAPRSLSDLPADAIDEILSRVTIDDAVRTSVLSRSWRHRWKSVPDLDLRGKPQSVVSRVLGLHSGGPIRVFKADRADPSTVSRWIDTLSIRAPSTLRTLHLSSSLDIQLCSLSRRFPGLTDLRLARFLLEYVTNSSSSELSGFPALQELHLQDVEFSFCSELSTFIPACPSLETLTVIGRGFVCDLHTIAIHVPRLIHLHVGGCIMDAMDIILSESGSSGFTALQTIHLADVQLTDDTTHAELTMFIQSAFPALKTVNVAADFDYEW